MSHCYKMNKWLALNLWGTINPLCRTVIHTVISPVPPLNYNYLLRGLSTCLKEIKSVQLRRISNSLRISFILTLFPNILSILLCLIIGCKFNKDICHITSLKSLMKTEASYRTRFNNTPLDILLGKRTTDEGFWGTAYSKLLHSLHEWHFHLDSIADPASVTWCQEPYLNQWCQEPYLNQTTRQSLISLVPRPVMLPTKKIRLVKQDSFLINLCVLLFNSTFI